MVHLFGQVTWLSQVTSLSSVQGVFFVTLFELKKLKTHSTPCTCFAFDLSGLTVPVI